MQLSGKLPIRIIEDLEYIYKSEKPGAGGWGEDQVLTRRRQRGANKKACRVAGYIWLLSIRMGKVCRRGLYFMQEEACCSCLQEDTPARLCMTKLLGALPDCGGRFLIDPRTQSLLILNIIFKHNHFVAANSYRKRVL